MRILLPLLLLSSIAFAQESATTLSTTTTELEKPSLLKNTKISGRISLSTTQAAYPVTFRSLKTTGVDEGSQTSSGGGGSDRNTAPNLRYFSASTSLKWTSKHETSLGLIKSLSPAEDRDITTPFGARFRMPGDIYFLRQAYHFTPEYSAAIMGGYTDISEYRDPSLSFGYQAATSTGFAPRWNLSASAPATPKSYESGLITKAGLRAGFGYRAITWGTFANISWNESFYKDTSKLVQSRGASAAAKRFSSPGARRPQFDTTDLVMSETEIRRTSSTAGIYFYPTAQVRLISSLGVSRIDTVKGNELWLTAVRPIGLMYRLGLFEASADVVYTSNVENYKSPSVPENLSIGGTLAMSFGERPSRR